MTATTVKFKCPHCQAQLEVGIKLAGTTGPCPNCGKEITVPDKNKQMPSEGDETTKKE